ncbi:MAG TPA: FtsX-like permease family protein [Aridibacter sp.]|nr:FtsX-like permease family protein [Aridibacter sp.]
MLELILANLRVRPFRTLISVIGVALGVVLVLLFTGLARGMTDDMAKRAANWKAEIVFTRPGSTGITSSNANVSTRYQERLLEIEGVRATVPVIRYISANSNARWGIEQIDGVEWGPFSEMNGIGIVEGRAPQANDEVVVDERHLRAKGLKLGGTTEIFGKDYKIVGEFAPPSGSRIKLTLEEMQENLQAPEMCTYILVKVEDGADPAVVAAGINEALPGNKVNLTRDLIIDAQDRVPGLNTFLQVLVGLGAFVSTIFVLLSMYTTITERRKEIGILKSLGASKSLIIRVIEGEALMIGVFGVIIGFTVSILASLAIEAAWELPFTFSAEWVATAITIAIAGSLVGALYPAWRASDIDPVEVMVNE